MLSNVQYTAFYKFLVSLGLVLVALSLSLPWLLLDGSFNLLVKQSDLNQLTATAQTTIRHRQAIVHVMSLVAPWISVVLSVLGVTLSSIGVVRWRTRQNIHDQTEDATLERLRAETAQIRRATPLEQDIRQSQEAWALLQAQPEPRHHAAGEGTPPEASYRDIKDRLREVEQLALEKLTRAFEDTHEIHSQQRLRLGDRTWLVDAILTSRSPDGMDLVVDVKYNSFDKNIKNRVIEAIAFTHQLMNRHSPLIQGHLLMPLFLFVAGGRAPERTAARAKAEIAREDRLPLRKYSLVLTEDELRRIDPPSLRAMVLAAQT